MRFETAFFFICSSASLVGTSSATQISGHYPPLVSSEVVENMPPGSGRRESTPESEFHDDKEDDMLLFSSRSPVRASQQGVDIVESGRKFGFFRRKGADVLQGAGQRLRANQDQAVKKESRAYREWEVTDRKYRNLQKFAHHFPILSEQQNVKQQGNDLLAARRSHAHRAMDASRTAKSIQQTIKNIGLVNKDMRSRMMKTFLPIRSMEAVSARWPKRTVYGNQGPLTLRRRRGSGKGKEKGWKRWHREGAGVHRKRAKASPPGKQDEHIRAEGASGNRH